jgi:hypothetical protein
MLVPDRARARAGRPGGVGPVAGELRAQYRAWVDQVVRAARGLLPGRLLGVVLYGSVGRERPHPGSDIDLMLVVEGLPVGRRGRAELAEAVEQATLGAAPDLPPLSLVLRTPAEVQAGFPLLLDMIAEGRIVWDPRGIVAGLFHAWEARLAAHGARRVVTGESWHWDLAGTASPGEWSL